MSLQENLAFFSDFSDLFVMTVLRALNSNNDVNLEQIDWLMKVAHVVTNLAMHMSKFEAPEKVAFQRMLGVDALCEEVSLILPMERIITTSDAEQLFKVKQRKLF